MLSAVLFCKECEHTSSSKTFTALQVEDSHFPGQGQVPAHVSSLRQPPVQSSTHWPARVQDIARPAVIDQVASLARSETRSQATLVF